jgi:hypothetical protein
MYLKFLDKFQEQFPSHQNKENKCISICHHILFEAVQKIFYWKTLTKKSQGRPKYRWEDNIKQDICPIKIKTWIACVQDRGKWKEVVEKFKTFN